MATQAKIDIKSAGGTTLLSTSINEGAKGYYSLMQHDYIVLPFKLRTPIDFKIGSYVDLRGVFDDALGGKLAKMYYVTELQNPSYNTSTGALRVPAQAERILLAVEQLHLQVHSRIDSRRGIVEPYRPA